MIRFLCSAQNGSQFPQTEKEVVFVGRSNVGKSSLINAIYNQKLAYVGKTPGKTKLINFFDVDELYTAVDVPGYGYARRSQNEAIAFGKMMDDYFDRKDKIALVIMIVDSRIGLTKDDLDMKDYLEAHQLRYLIAAKIWTMSSMFRQRKRKTSRRSKTVLWRLLADLPLSGR